MKTLHDMAFSVLVWFMLLGGWVGLGIGIGLFLKSVCQR